jgi:hypothetical protein
VRGLSGRRTGLGLRLRGEEDSFGSSPGPAGREASLTMVVEGRQLPQSPNRFYVSRIAKRCTFLLSILCVFLWSHAGAASVNVDDPDQIRTRATILIEEIIQGISEGDYVLYSRQFSRPMKESQTRENFLELQRSLQKAIGKFQSLQYLGFYAQHGNLITLFKARFSKDKDDVLIRLVMKGSATDSKVTGLWFDSPALEK